MVTSKNPIRYKLEIGRKVLEQVTDFQNLGTDVSSDRNAYEEARRQASRYETRSSYFWIFKGCNLENNSNLKGSEDIQDDVTSSADFRS